MPRTVDTQEQTLASLEQSRARTRKSSLIDVRYARDATNIPSALKCRGKSGTFDSFRSAYRGW